jgi:putative peptidoglycan lipid II flippase
MGARRQSIEQTTIGIVLLVLISKAVGFGREMIVAYKFGTGIEYDTYLIGVSIPLALYTLAGYAFSNLFIPRYGHAVSGDDSRSGLRVFWTDVNLSLLIAVAVMFAIIVFAHEIIRLIAPGLDAAHIPQAVFISRVSSVIVVLGILEAFFRSILNAEKKFLIPAAGPILANVVLIAVIIAFAGRISTRAILYGVVAGYTAHAILVFVPFTRTGILRSFYARIFHRRTGSFLAVASIILIIEAASQVYAVVDRYFASEMVAGVVSALGYAYMLSALPTAIFAYALSTVLFPYMTDASAGADTARSAHLITRGVCVALLLALPATMIYWVFSRELVLLLLRRGAFDMRSVTFTSDLLKYFALGMAGQFLIWVLSRAYYAGQKYGLLIFQVVMVIAAKIVFSIIGVDAFGYIGLAVASSVSYIVGAIVLLTFTGSILVKVDGRAILAYVVRVLIATAAGFGVGAALNVWMVAGTTQFGPLLVRASIAIGSSLLAFVATAYAINIPDVRNLAARVLLRERGHGDQN